MQKLIHEIEKKNHDMEEQRHDVLTQSEEMATLAEEIYNHKSVLEQQNEEIKSKNEHISESYKRLEALADFGQQLTCHLTIKGIHEMVYEYMGKIVDISAFGIGLFQEFNNCISFPTFIEHGEKKASINKHLDDKKSLTALCFNQQRPLIIRDIEKEYKKYVPELNLSVTNQLAYSRIHIPLTVENNKIGVLVINSYEKNAYSSEDITNIISLASYISIALDNARAYQQLTNINASVNESINYAKGIQKAFLPTKEKLDKYLNTFVIYKPKDIVSGDFYWFSTLNSQKGSRLKAFIAVADCTGHGVPGALLTSIGSYLLDKYINTYLETHVAIILQKINDEFQVVLQQEKSLNNDGMDIALCYLQELEHEPDGAGGQKKASFKVSFAGAKLPLVIYRAETKELEIIKGTRRSIGGLRAKKSKQEYEKQDAEFFEGDVLYLFSDGIIDQHSPERGRFTRDRLMELLNDNAAELLSVQESKIREAIANHMKNERQTDDITLLAIKF
ncbi:MAG: SpoIIE family protein phosphatase, partial [Bacteroidales bacterium]|nr:SpoIIE family protein phosphatase [Bacteroidales bacterium]